MILTQDICEPLVGNLEEEYSIPGNELVGKYRIDVSLYGSD
jgi:hypothetical protein